jgi:hypothetical protein
MVRSDLCQDPGSDGIVASDLMGAVISCPTGTKLQLPQENALQAPALTALNTLAATFKIPVVTNKKYI